MIPFNPYLSPYFYFLALIWSIIWSVLDRIILQPIRYLGTSHTRLSDLEYILSHRNEGQKRNLNQLTF